RKGEREGGQGVQGPAEGLRQAAEDHREPARLVQQAGVDGPGVHPFFFSSRRRHTSSVSAFLLNRSSDLDVLAAQPVTTNLLKFMRASIKMIGVSNLQSFIASMTQKLTLSDISDESKNYLDKAGITTACLRIKSKWTAGGK